MDKVYTERRIGLRETINILLVKQRDEIKRGENRRRQLLREEWDRGSTEAFAL